MTAQEFAGRFMVQKYRRQAIYAGTYRAALNLRRQGVPLAVALMILCGRVI